MAELLSPEKIKEYTRYDLPVQVLESTTSTNTVAAQLLDEGASHGTAVFARHQTGGRGRLGRSFASPAGSGIYMSVILQVTEPLLLTTAAAVAVCRAIENICGAEPEIKWVNDIYLNKKKVCGILAEAVTDPASGIISHVILGIGINCDSSALPAELSEIAGAIGGDFSLNKLAAEVLNHLLDITKDLSSPDVIKAYRERSMVTGKTISVYKGGYSPEAHGRPARVMDIADNGGLKVIYSDGSRETLTSGEISIRLQE